MNDKEKHILVLGGLPSRVPDSLLAYLAKSPPPLGLVIIAPSDEEQLKELLNSMSHLDAEDSLLAGATLPIKRFEVPEPIKVPNKTETRSWKQRDAFKKGKHSKLPKR